MTRLPNPSPPDFLPVEGDVLYPLPRAYRLAIPRLAELRIPREARADCKHCVMMAPTDRTHESTPWSFHPDVRCCTHHPEIPNFFAGQALLRGPEAAALIRKRLDDPAGVLDLGIVPQDAYEERRKASTLGFGKDPALRCPFFVPKELTCGIWPERGTRCRTYFCKHEHGTIAIERLRVLTGLVEIATVLLAKLCAKGRTAPQTGSPVDDWANWYVDCAHRLETLTGADVLDVPFRGTNDSCDRIADLASITPEPMPDVIVPYVQSHIGRTGDDCCLIGHNVSDGVVAGSEIFTFFTLLDGERSWQEASSRMADLGLSPVDPSLVRELYRTGVMKPVSELIVRNQADARAAACARIEDLPEQLAVSVHEPIWVGDDVWLQGATTFLSLIAPRGVFRFLARIDDSTPWREAFAEARAEDPSSIDLDLVVRLYQAGVLVAPAPAPAE